jgi:BlaI family transcriptional regulator, penicillinase repressor
VSRTPPEILTEREAQIMDVLWRQGEAMADEVRAELPGQPHDSTVRTLLRILETKGFVAHATRGKSYIYRPAVERAQAQRSALRNFLGRLFGGSAEDLVLRLIEDEVLTPEQLEQIRKQAQPRSPRRRKGGSS